jgi:hypothetical protein
MRTSIALLVLLVAAPACGKVRLPGSGSDGGEPGDDGGGSADAAEPGPVTVTVLSFDGQRTPVEGTQVAFFDVDGSHRVTRDTNADGVATADLSPGGAVVAFVDAAPTGSPSRAARAVLAVAPGDQIVIGGQPFVGGATVNDMTITLPVVTGTPEYIVYTPCGTFSSGTEVVYVAFYAGCDVDSFAYLATANGDEGPSFLREPDAPVIPGGNYDAMSAWQVTPTRAFRYTGVPDEASTIDAGVFGYRIDGQQLNVFMTRDAADAVSDTLTLRPQRIPSYDQTMHWALVRAEQPSLGSFNVVHWQGPDAATEWDLSELMLPWMGPIGFDAATRRAGWQMVGTGTWDATYLTVVASSNDGEKFRETQWFIVAPPGIEEIVLPELPAELTEYYLPDPQNVFAYGQIVESSELDGYPEARQKGFDPSYEPRLEPAGSVTRSSFSGNPDS